MKGKQTTLSISGFDRFAKPTRRELFLAEMDKIVPWSELYAVVEPFCPRQGSGAGRPPVGWSGCCASTFCSSWFNLSDPAAEEARRTIRWPCAVSSASTWGANRCPTRPRCASFAICWRRTHLGKALFEQVHHHLEAQGIKVGRGTIVDATIIDAPSSTKNADKAARPGHAPDQEGPAVVLRHEGAHRRGQRAQSDPLGGGHRGQRGRLARSCPICCTGRRRASTATKPTADRTGSSRERAPQARDFTNRRCRHKGGWTKWSGR